MPIRQKEFSLQNIKSIYDDAAESLANTISKYNPSFDGDSFDMELRQLVMRYGRSSGMYSLASEAANLKRPNTKAVYNQAGDILSLARETFKSGDIKEALNLFITAQDSDGIDDLMEAILINNSKSNIAALSQDGSDSEETDESAEDEPASEEDSEESSEDDDEDNGELFSIDDDSEVDAEENINRGIKNLASLTGEGGEEDTNENKEERTPEPDEEDAEVNKDKKKVPMDGASSDAGNTTTTVTKLEKQITTAAANRMSLDGTKQSREKALKIIRRAS